MPTVEYTRYEKRWPEEYPLGRNQELDSRSLGFKAAPAPKLLSVEWPRDTSALDQLRIGACTGFAAEGALLTEPFVDMLGLRHTTIEEATAWAFSFYSGATTRDQFVGNFPPNDEGSSGLGICRHLKQLGLISGYRWGTTPRTFASMLQAGPVLIGMPWVDAFFEPDRSGFIDAEGWDRSALAGGHEVEVIGIKIDEDNLDDSILECVNSWSAAWGDHGRFRMRMSTYVALRDGCDLKQFII